MKQRRRVRKERKISPEQKILQLAKKGALLKAGKKAIEQSHKMGLPVTIIENGIIIRLHPDGTKEQIGLARSRKANRKYSGKMYIR